jgi:hypothetical protein
MQEIEIHEYARQLWEAHGLKSIAEAAHKAIEFERQGEKERAHNWRRIEAVLLQLRGPRQK